MKTYKRYYVNNIERLVIREDNKVIKTYLAIESIYKNKLIIGKKNVDLNKISKDLEDNGYIREYSAIEKILLSSTKEEKVCMTKSFKHK